MRKISLIQRAERIARKPNITLDESSILIDMLNHIERNDENSPRMQRLARRINYLLEKTEGEYTF